MGLRFRKSFKIAPGIRMNVGKKGLGVSFGGKGLRYSINSSGRRTTTAGIPGTGLYYSTSSSSGKSYKTDAYRRRSELNRMQREQAKLQELEYARLQVDLFENRLEQIRSIHHECDDPIDWKEVSTRPRPFPEGTKGPNEQAALEKLTAYKPGFFDKLLKKSEAKTRQLEEEIQEAAQKDEQLIDDWKALLTVANRILSGDIDAYFEVIDDFGPLDDLVEFGSEFEFGTDNPEVIHVSFDIHAEKVVPEKALSLTKTGKVSEKAIPKTTYLDIYQDYVCSSALRIARDMFALLPVKYVFVHAYENRFNSATGQKERILILSVKYDRDIMTRLNFTALDPSDALSNFEHKMNFKKTKGFEEVEEIIG